MKILQTVQRCLAFLNFVKDDQCRGWLDGRAMHEGKILKNSGHIFGGCEELGQLGLFVKVEVGYRGIFPASQFL